MEIHQLRYFVAAAEELSITAAANRLYLSQPALSRQIKALEEEIGLPLFDRVKQRIHLTKAGELFLKRARQILCDIESSIQEVQETFGTAKQQVQIGFLSIFLDDIVAPTMKALRKRSSNLEVTLHELPPSEQLTKLRDDKIDLALLGNLSDEDRTRFETRCIMRSPMAVVVPDDHRLARRKQLVLRELAGEPFVSLSNAVFPGRRKFLRSLCLAQGFEPEIIEESDSLSLLLGCVGAGDGVALLPQHSQKLPHVGTVYIPLNSPVVFAEVLAVYKPNRPVGVFSEVLTELESVASHL